MLHPANGLVYYKLFIYCNTVSADIFAKTLVNKPAMFFA